MLKRNKARYGLDARLYTRSKLSKFFEARVRPTHFSSLDTSDLFLTKNKE